MGTLRDDYRDPFPHSLLRTREVMCLVSRSEEVAPCRVRKC